jgi:hypothetical protein
MKRKKERTVKRINQKSHAAAFCCILEGGDAEEPSAAHAAVGHGARLGRALGAREGHYDTPARGARPARMPAVQEPRPDAARCLAIITSSNSSSAGGLLLCNMVVAWCDLLFVPLSAAADPSSRAASADPPDASA